MPVTGSPRVFEDKFKFIVEIDGVAHAGFSKCSALEVEIEKIEYREGGRLTAHKSPGLVNVSDVTLERGAVADDADLYNVFVQVANMASESGDVEDTFRFNFDIVVLDRDDTALKRWRCTNCWINKFVAGEWDNSSSEKTIEMVTIVVEKFKRVAA